MFTLDEDTAGFFGARYLHLLRADDRMIGRFGRRGSIKGRLEESVLRATWFDGTRRGWITARFDPVFKSFSADYGLDDDRMTPIGRCRGEVKLRRRSRGP